jgi:hypothetical protein
MWPTGKQHNPPHLAKAPFPRVWASPRHGSTSAINCVQLRSLPATEERAGGPALVGAAAALVCKISLCRMRIVRNHFTCMASIRIIQAHHRGKRPLVAAGMADSAEHHAVSNGRQCAFEHCGRPRTMRAHHAAPQAHHPLASRITCRLVVYRHSRARRQVSWAGPHSPAGARDRIQSVKAPCRLTGARWRAALLGAAAALVCKISLCRMRIVRNHFTFTASACGWQPHQLHGVHTDHPGTSPWQTAARGRGHG